MRLSLPASSAPNADWRSALHASPAPAQAATFVLDASAPTTVTFSNTGVTQTNAGDLKMVSEWKRLPFVVRNPGNADYPFVGVERTPRKPGESS